MKIKLFGNPAQTRAVLAPGVLLTRVIFRLNRTPAPESGVKSFEKAETRSVLIVPAPITLPETFQLVPVRPAPDTGGFWKVTIDESKVKSPWNPTRLSAPLIAVFVTCSVKLVTPVLMVSFGKKTTSPLGVPVGVGDAGTVAV